jgi:hypothetical protein
MCQGTAIKLFQTISQGLPAKTADIIGEDISYSLVVRRPLRDHEILLPDPYLLTTVYFNFSVSIANMPTQRQ